ncbi:MAG: hypothetical protein WKH64_00890 [Chloroflexia bacterium]
MTTLFGINLEQLMYVLLGVFGAAMLVLALLALRNPVVFKMGVRNVPRRPAQTGLIVLGLMLATLLFSASFTTGDTLTHSQRVQVVESLGEVDVQVRAATSDASDVEEILGSAARRTTYFDWALTARVRAARERSAGRRRRTTDH